MKLKFSVESIQANKDSFLSLKVLQDSITRFESRRLAPGGHEFEFESKKQTHIDFLISNKDPKHTVLHGHKNIKDTLVRVKSIFVNDQDVTSKINLFSNYFTPQYGTVKTNGWMTYNGTYSFKFRYPASNHILYCTHYKPKN